MTLPRFPSCRKHGVYFQPPCPRCHTEQRRKANGECLAMLFHGPGHQSKTYCQVMGDHKIHKAVYGSYEQVATWKTKKKFTGYFDEPPSCTKD